MRPLAITRRLRGSAAAQFALSGLVATVLIGLIAVGVSRQIGRQEAIREARHVTRLAGEGIVAPNVDAKVIAGDPQALRRLDRLVRGHVLRDGVVRVKIWSADGTVVYSDEQRLIGTRFALEHQELEAFRGHAVEAEISDLGRPENRLERPEGKLLEVYLPIRGRDGQPLLFEAYQRYSSVSAGGHRLWLAFAPALLGGLLLLQLVNVPLARSMARRLRDGQQERAELLQRALHAQQTERRLIAANLHDGVVQDLAATSFALAAQSERLNGHGDREAADALRHGAAHTRDSVRALRTLLVDIYPPSLRQSGLAAALGDLAKTCTARGMQTTVDIREDDDLDEQTEQLLFRCAQETLRNTQKHAGATAAIVAVRDDAHRIVMEVSDDGSGVDPDVIAARREGGHFGLRMLEDLVTDAGGRLDVVSAPGAGTTVRVEVPR